MYNIFKQGSVDPIELQTLQEVDLFFVKLNPKDAFNHSPRIREYALLYYASGYFAQYNNIFSRYIKNMRDLNDTEMHEFIIRYIVSCVIKRNYESAISDIQNLRQFYIQHDMNVYIYFLKMVRGNYTEASDIVLNIGQNIYEGFWKILTYSDLAFYFMFSLLVCFQRHVLKELKILSGALVCKFFEDNPSYLILLENYERCRFDWIVEEFEKFSQEKITSDIILSNNYRKIQYDFKTHIMKDIIKCSQAVSIDYLAKVLKEDQTKVENWIVTGISEGYLKVKIDDIDKIIYQAEENSNQIRLKNGLNFSENVYSDSIYKILRHLTGKILDIKDIQQSDLKQYMIRGYYENPNMDYYQGDGEDFS
jgi:hypothetical protein